MNTTQLIGEYYAGRRDFDGVSLQSETLQSLELRECTFRRADLRNVEFGGIGLYKCDLSFADLRNCSMPKLTVFEDCLLERADLRNSLLVNTQFTRSALVGSDFSRARLKGVWFQQCELSHAWLSEIRFENVTLSGCGVRNAFIGGAVFINTDITNFVEAEQLRFGKSEIVVDWRSVCRSLKAVRLASFLRTSGMPEVVITYLISSARTEDPDFLLGMFQSTFISYGSPDEPFARRLRDALHRNGVKTFFFPADAVPGRKLHEVMREGVNRFDRVILVCSRASLSRPGVLNEIQEALAREARDGGVSYLIPVTLDGFLFEWDHPLAQPLRDRVVADFRAVDVEPEGAPHEAYSGTSPYRAEPQDLFDVAASPAIDGFHTALRSLLIALRPNPADT